MIEIKTLKLETIERLAIDEACRQARTLAEAADLLGISRYALRRRLQGYEIRSPGERNRGVA